MTDDKREALAALEHEQWAHWTRYMLKTLNPLLSSNLHYSSHREKAEAALERWLRQINTPYADLTEQEKESDREWAALAVVALTTSPLDGAYSERAQCVAALVRLALGMGLPAGIVPATPDEWACAYIDTPEGQVAWHVAETDLHHFDGIPTFGGDTSQTYTTDEKYRRLSLWAGRRNLDGDGSVRPIEDDYQRYLEDKEADWKEDQKSLAKEVEQRGKEDLAQHEITQFLRYLQTCGGHDAPFDLKAHLPRIQRLLDAHDEVCDV